MVIRKGSLLGGFGSTVVVVAGLMLNVSVCAAEVVEPIVAEKESAVTAVVATATPVESSPIDPNAAFAQVDDIKITVEDFSIALSQAIRSRFYHGAPPQGELAPLQREIGDKLVNEVLLVREAKKRGVVPEDKLVADRLQQIDERNGSIESWKANRETYLPRIKAKLEGESLLAQFEALVRKVASPTEVQLKAYYDAHPEKFTEPEQLRVSIILLSVDPSSPGTEWMKAFEFGRELVAKIRGGDDFAKLAKEFSGEQASAEYGGDMGYLHDGMLPTAAQTVLDDMEVNQISEPVRLLEGVAIFKLTDRSKSKLGSFDKVKSRAADLWLKDEAERVWKDLIASLRKAAVIKIEEKYYLPMPESTPETKSVSDAQVAH